MKILDKYIYRELTLPIIFGISLFSFMFLIDMLVQMMENLLVKSVPLADVVALLSYSLPPIFSETIPMGVFLGVMITFGSLSSNSEVIAMESVGISLNRLIKPTFQLSVIFMLFIYFLHQSVVPQAGNNLRLLSRKIAYTKPAVQLEEKVFVTGIGSYSVYINKLEPNSTVAESLVVLKKENGSTYPTVMLSDKAVWKNSKMILEDADFYQINNTGTKELEGKFAEQVIPIASFFGDFTGEKVRPSNMSITDLRKEVSLMKKAGKKALKYEIELYKKIYIPTSILFLPILGILLSIQNSRSGKGVSFGISIVIIFVYISIMQVFVMLAKKEQLEPVISMAIPNIILGLSALFLYIKKARSR